jgi:RNA polymerase sigma-70 factor (ECF subfamily)
METDATLVEKIKANNDHDAFLELYERHRARILAVCRRILKDPTSAEDAAQDAFLSAYCKLDSFHGDAQFGTWLHKIARNVALTYLRKPYRSMVSLEAEPTLPLGRRDTALEHCPEWREFIKAFNQLPPQHQLILNLRSIMGYSYREIAVMLGCDVPCCKSRHRMALIYARRILSRPANCRAKDIFSQRTSQH